VWLVLGCALQRFNSCSTSSSSIRT
jgi:hypothetical protein